MLGSGLRRMCILKLLQSKGMLVKTPHLLSFLDLSVKNYWASLFGILKYNCKIDNSNPMVPSIKSSIFVHIPNFFLENR